MAETVVGSRAMDTFPSSPPAAVRAELTARRAAIGFIWHPSSVDSHAGTGTPTSLAECRRVDANGDPLWRATMCTSDSAPGGIAANEHRTERRTLHAWDIESFRQQHSRH